MTRFSTAPRYLGVIPARGGSRRLPGKNLLLFDGEPLLGRAIRRAREAGRLDALVVSTEDAAIAAVALDYGAERVIRPAALATDTASVRDVLRHALDTVETNCAAFDAVVLLQPTSPFRSARHIVESLRLYEEAGGDTLVSVHPSRDHAYYQLLIEDGLAKPFFDWEKLATPRHALPGTFVENGLIWIFDVGVLRRGKAYGGRVVAYPTAPQDGVDIDTREDFLFAEFLLARAGDGA